MGMPDKAANSAEILKGKIKEAAGKITGSPRLKVEGKLDQGKGNLKQAGAKIKDAGKSLFGR